MQIRRVEPEEWERFREIRLRALDESAEAFGSTAVEESGRDEDAWRAWITGWEGDAHQAAFVAEEDDRWIGLAVGVVFADRPDTGRLFAMWVEPEARGRGAGAALVEAVALWTAAVGGVAVELCVVESNPAAVSLYERTGFRDTGERDVLREGSEIATVTMRRSLDVAEGEVERVIAEQMRYYEDRAPVYDKLYLRQDHYDLGEVGNSAWFADTEALEQAVVAFEARGKVLELACGTGLWTRFLAAEADRLVAVDASPAMLARNREQVGDPSVEYLQADLYSWETAERFDAIFFGFFLSHVPPDRFDRFWERLRGWLAPGGRVLFCDDVAGPGRPFSGDLVPGLPFANRRTLSEDRTYEIVKIFWTPTDLETRLARVGWTADVSATPRYFLYGSAEPAR